MRRQGQLSSRDQQSLDPVPSEPDMDRDAAHALSIEELNRLQELVAWQLPFGDSTYVLRHLRKCLVDRLERAASGYVSASNLIAATAGHDEDHLDRLFADTTLRCAIVQAHEETVAVRQDSIPTIDCDAIFAAAARFLESASTFRSPIQDGSLQPIGQRSYHGLVWTADHAYDSVRSSISDVDYPPIPGPAHHTVREAA